MRIEHVEKDGHFSKLFFFCLLFSKFRKSQDHHHCIITTAHRLDSTRIPSPPSSSHNIVNDQTFIIMSGGSHENVSSLELDKVKDLLSQLSLVVKKSDDSSEQDGFHMVFTCS